MPFVSTPYYIGSVLAVLMHLILPTDMEVVSYAKKPEKNDQLETVGTKSSQAIPAKAQKDSPPAVDEEDAKNSTVEIEEVSLLRKIASGRMPINNRRSSLRLRPSTRRPANVIGRGKNLTIAQSVERHLPKMF